MTETSTKKIKPGKGKSYLHIFKDIIDLHLQMIFPLNASAFDAVGADSQVVPGGLVPRRTEMGRVLEDFMGNVDFMGEHMWILWETWRNMEKHGGFCPIDGENWCTFLW